MEKNSLAISGANPAMTNSFFLLCTLEYRRSNVDNLNNVRRDASRYFRNKKKAYLKDKIEELETNSKINNVRDFYRGINDFKKGYQPRTILVKDEKGDLVVL